MNIHFYSLLPGISSEVGHLFHYHLSTEKAVSSLGWKFHAIIPQKTNLPFTPDSWIPLLANDSWERKKGLFFRIYILFANVLPLNSFFQSLRHESHTIVFLEQFELQHLGSLFLSLLFFKPKFQFWLLHRYAFKTNHYKTQIYRFFHWYIEKKLKAANVRYLTDSELLSKELAKVFKKNFQVLPIPHTETTENKSSPAEENSALFWWPGGSIREDKGLRTIHHLLDLLKTNSQAKIVVAEKGKAIFKDHTNLLFVPTRLSREEYLNWMQKANIILLPYSAKDYAYRTSGIFVEAVSLGAIPVTTNDTWMAYELNKYDLSKLVFSWNEPNLIDLLLQLKSDKKILQRLQIMRTNYQKFHSEKGFAQTVSDISIGK